MSDCYKPKRFDLDMKKTKKTIGRKIKLKGLVMPTGWDEKGNVSAVNISTHDEKDYPVLLNEKGKELLSIIRTPVKVTGSLRMEKTIKILNVEEYNIIEERHNSWNL